MNFFSDYFWREGKPVGLSPGETFRILSDPYRKRFSIEEYKAGKFHRIVYDSNLFDFRQLFMEEETSWQREQIGSTDHTATTLIRDIHDRIILKEELFYENSDCLSCKLYSPHGIFLAEQTLLLKSRGATLNGVLLTDPTGRAVLQKEYVLDTSTGVFNELLHEIRSFPPTAACTPPSSHFQ